MVVALAPNHEGDEKNPTLAQLTATSNDLLRSYENKVYVVSATLVHPDHRGMGLGKKLMDEMVRWIEASCMALGREGVAVLAARRWNEGALKLYKGAGFEIHGDDELTQGNEIISLYRKVGQVL